MDEITHFAELKPPPPEDVAALRARTWARLSPAIGAPGRPPRRRRRLALGLSVVAAAVCTATVVPSVLFGGNGTPAYAVTRNPDGSVNVKISDIADAADARGLQQALRAEGIRTLVWAGTDDQTPPGNPFCQAPASNLEPESVQKSVVTEYPTDVPPGIYMVTKGTADEGPGWVGFVIRPAAMPTGSVLYFVRVYEHVMSTVEDSHGHILSQRGGDEIPPPQVLRSARLPC